ncbi:EamA family transporter [Flavobacterium amniphilum]|uniref:EamA family transporter n=1 Tax=Flavobacterium amniphilum TaxID=1834035 RepID=UPI002029FCB3|nr:EamA family transporter [Flavobacterium amniphilum]MCL9805019.1 EamA family transporter [Flavobacterium amniphilum]
MSISNTKFTIQVLIAFASIYIIWGSTFLAIAIALHSFPPFVLSGLRFFTAGLILFVWQRSKGHKGNSFVNWRKNAIVGILILTGGSGLVAWGEQYVSSTEAAIAIATGPFWFVALDKKNWKHYFSNVPIVLGLIIGFIGLILFLKGSVSTENLNANGTQRIIAFGVLTLSSISWVLGSLYSKRNPANQPTFMNTAQQLIAAGVASFFIALLKGEWQTFEVTEVTSGAWFGLAFLIFFGSIVAYMSYIWLLGVKDPVLVSTHTYINPIVAVLLGWFIANEQIGSNQLLGLFVILSGVLLTNSANYKPSKRVQVRIRRVWILAKALLNTPRSVAQ